MAVRYNSEVRAEDVWYGEGLGPAAARSVLTPLSWLYAGGWQAYLGLYRFGLKKASEPHVPVICVGNLVVGGSGKSPLTLYLARFLREMGRSVVISCSGYGSPRAEAASLAPDAELDAAEWGDEPAMIRMLMPDVPLVVGRRRVLAAELVARQFPDAVMLMDDGFQHLPLKKHLSIVLDPPQAVNARTLPAGPYREPRRNRSRADLVLPGEFKAVMQPLVFADPLSWRDVDVPRNAVPLCALGQPDGFLMLLKIAGVDIGPAVLLPDHDPLTAGNLLSRLPVERPIVTTAKDWVKLRSRPDVGSRRFVVALRQDRIEPESEFRDWLAARLDEIGS